METGRKKATYSLMVALMVLLLSVLGVSVLATIALLAAGQGEMFQEGGDGAFIGPWGRWVVVGATVVVFSFFSLGYILPLGRRDWRSAGMLQAFIIALFTEMFGIPLTVYLVSGALGGALSLQSGDHLLARVVSTLTGLDMGMAITGAMALSLFLLMLALYLVFLGWKEIYRAGGRLVTWGIYRYIRHPQYLGLLLFIFAWLIQWPTVFTVVLAPVLAFTYYRLARREESALEREFGEEYRLYRKAVPMFLPRLG